jgi:5-methylcytosine-specific restriction endonuclease McrA
MTEEGKHYTRTTKVHKSLVTSLDSEPVTRYKHILRPGLLRAILEVYSTIAEHITRILLAPGTRWWPCGEQLLDAAHSMSHFVPDYGMQTRACSSAWAASTRRASHAYQEPAVSPRVSTASPPNSP